MLDPLVPIEVSAVVETLATPRLGTNFGFLAETAETPGFVGEWEAAVAIRWREHHLKPQQTQPRQSQLATEATLNSFLLDIHQQ